VRIQDKLEHEILELNKRKKVMIVYLQLKTSQQDWHGVSDAANDLRDIEAEQLGYVNLLRYYRKK